MHKIISGIQQVGIGVPDEKKAWAWYRKHFGMDIPVFQEAAEAPFMTPYTGGTVHARSATLALNLRGGGGMEIWQYTSRSASPPSFKVLLGDYGIFVTRIKCVDVEATYERYRSEGLQLLGAVSEDPAGGRHFFMKDPHGFIFQIVEGQDWFTSGKRLTGGPSGCMIGVSDIERARTLYSDILGYDCVEYDETGRFQDFACLPGGNDHAVRRVLLSHSRPRSGSFSRLLGASRIELVHTANRKPRHIFEDRYWGDCGFIHLCFDVHGMDVLAQECEMKGFPFTVDSSSSFDMGEASGRFSYIEDPDGTLIEFVETHKIPILKKWGWYLNLKNRDPKKPLPNWMLKTLSMNRVQP